MTVSGTWALAASLVLGACGARSIPTGTETGDEWVDGGGPLDDGPFVPGTELRGRCRSGPDLRFTLQRNLLPGPECGLGLLVEHLVENCGSEIVEPPVVVQLLAGNPREGSSRILREVTTAPGMPAGMGQWVVFEVPAEEWAAAVEEFSQYGPTYYLLIDPTNEVDECTEGNNHAPTLGNCT